MKCKNCGADIPDADSFCRECGRNVENINTNKKKDNRDTYNKKHKEAGYDIMTVMSTATAFLILTAAVSIVFVLVIKQTSVKNVNNVNNNIAQSEETCDDSGDGAEAAADAAEAAETNAEIQSGERSIGTITIVSDVNIRDNPDTDNSNVIKVAKASETYEYLGMADYNNWYIILLEDGTKGYVYKGYVSTE